MKRARREIIRILLILTIQIQVYLFNPLKTLYFQGFSPT